MGSGEGRGGGEGSQESVEVEALSVTTPAQRSSSSISLPPAVELRGREQEGVHGEVGRAALLLVCGKDVKKRSGGWGGRGGGPTQLIAECQAS